MPAFSIAPAQGFARPPGQGFPNYMQIQNQGVNLGLPNVDTLNFGSGLTATRGTGENANTVTVTGEGGGPQTLLVNAEIEGFAGSGVSYSMQTVLVESADTEWDPTIHQINFITSGFYRIIVSVQVAPLSGSWQESTLMSLSLYSGGASRYARSPADGYLSQFPLTIDTVFYVGKEVNSFEGILIEVSQFGGGSQQFVGALTIEVQRIGDYVPT